MKKDFKIFFSWQADLPSSQTKRFIEECIELAKANLDDLVEIVPDEATRNKFGSPDIMNSIFDKIKDCDLFIADTSIVGKYYPVKSSDDDEVEEKFFPNPNVLLELGYAAASVSWERCICLTNTKYGALKKLPFDLNHRRVTGYEYKGKDERKSEIKRISSILEETVKEYINNPLPKVGFSHHIIGGYNLDTSLFENKLIPYNNYTFSLYKSTTQDLINKAKKLVDEISKIKLPARLKEEPIQIPDGMTFEEAMKDPKYEKAFSLKLGQSKDIEPDKKYIGEQVDKLLGIKLDDDFYNIGNLTEFSIPLVSSSLEGTEDEKKKYHLLNKLNGILLTIELRNIYVKTFKDVMILPLAIHNSSHKTDERIDIVVSVVKGTPIDPSKDFFDDEYVGLQGLVYDKHLPKEILELKETANIKMDSSIVETPQIPRFKTPIIGPFGRMTEPQSDENDYAEELQEYVQETNVGTNEYSFYIGALRPQEMLWLDKVMLIRPVDGEIVVKYFIKSNNTRGDLSGTLYL